MGGALESYGMTHAGNVRDHNEDSIFLSDDLGLYLVADGMGGSLHGEVASALAVESITKWFAAPDRSRSISSASEAIRLANEKVHQSGKNQSEGPEESGTLISGRMGTTVVLLHIEEDIASIAHVGDSRIYRVRNKQLEALTRDHSLAAMAAAGRNVPQPPSRTPFKHVLTRAVGPEPTVEVEIREEKLQEKDLFLLCSDGLTNMVSDERIREVLLQNQSLQSACQTLVDEANQNGGRDNISCLLIQYRP